MNEARRVYGRLRAVFGARARQRAAEEAPGGRPFTNGRDPRHMGDVVTALAHQFGWDDSLDRAEIVVQWEAIAGEDIARQTTVGFEGDTLVVICRSTAWATNLRRMRAELLGKIREQFPRARIDDIRFRGPDAPSWRAGPRTIPGRGPRDTYG